MVDDSKEQNKDWTISEDIFEVIALKSHENIKSICKIRIFSSD